MPVVFSPGEPETRPLNPDAIVYTTAQKVADILGVGPGEAVLMAANAEANGVFVTGADYRDHGFSVGDTIQAMDLAAIGTIQSLTTTSIVVDLCEEALTDDDEILTTSPVRIKLGLEQ